MQHLCFKIGHLKSMSARDEEAHAMPYICGTRIGLHYAPHNACAKKATCDLHHNLHDLAFEIQVFQTEHLWQAHVHPRLTSASSMFYLSASMLLDCKGSPHAGSWIPAFWPPCQDIIETQTCLSLNHAVVFGKFLPG